MPTACDSAPLRSKVILVLYPIPKVALQKKLHLPECAKSAKKRKNSRKTIGAIYFNICNCNHLKVYLKVYSKVYLKGKELLACRKLKKYMLKQKKC